MFSRGEFRFCPLFLAEGAVFFSAAIRSPTARGLQDVTVFGITKAWTGASNQQQRTRLVHTNKLKLCVSRLLLTRSELFMRVGTPVVVLGSRVLVPC
jgi:hypothetical protein